MSDAMPHVVIVGGGFGGLAAAKALRKTNARVILIDRQNHHLFQPLLYQVATSVLSPGQIASPIRGILRKQGNTTVLLGEVTRVDSDRRCVFVDSLDREGVIVEYDYLILATFSEKLSAAAKHRLEELGVEVRLGHGVDHIDAEGVMVAGERIASKTVIWTAGVAPSPAGKWLKAATDRAGRVRVEPDLTVPAHPEIFVIGDTASLEQDGRPLPGVAQVAMQQGRYAGTLIHRRIGGQPKPRPFRYFG